MNRATSGQLHMRNRYSENGTKNFLCLVKESFSPNVNFFLLLEINLARKGLIKFHVMLKSILNPKEHCQFRILIV